MKTRFCIAVACACASMVNVEAGIISDPCDYNANLKESQLTDLLFISEELIATNGIEPWASLTDDTINGRDERNYVIALTHPTKSKVKYIPQGKKLSIWCGEEKIKGRITSITPDSIYIDHLAYSPNQIGKVRAFLPGTTAGGAVMTAGGIGALGLGGYLGTLSIITIIEAEGEAWAVFFGTLGLLLSAPILSVGVVLIPTGIIVIAQGRTFNVVSKWKLSIINQPGPLK